MMNARFRITNPGAVEITLSLTAQADEWATLKTALEEADDLDDAAAQLARKLAHLIEHAQQSLATETWTTGYTTGEVKDAS